MTPLWVETRRYTNVRFGWKADTSQFGFRFGLVTGNAGRGNRTEHGQVTSPGEGLAPGRLSRLPLWPTDG